MSGNSRLSGRLAIDGGTPVRDTRVQPWPAMSDGNARRWRSDVRELLRQVYVGGVEGLPQPLARNFADQWARYCGTRYGLVVGHGTDALRIALAAMLEHDGLAYGGEIIVPNFSFIASATAALDRRFGIALVDVDPHTLLLDPSQVEAAIVPGKTRAIMPVHLFGQPADMTRLRAIADAHGLRIVEDAAQAHGASWMGQRVGALGDVGAFSFQSAKTLSCGEGGALVTDDAALFERAYAMHNVGRSRTRGGRWEHETLGWNCRPTEYQCALLLQRLAAFHEEQAVRSRNFAHLRQLLHESRALAPVSVKEDVTSHGMYMFAARYIPEHSGCVGIDQFVKALRAEGAPVVRSFASTIADQPAIRDLVRRRPEYVRVLDTPVADQAARETVYIPHDVFLGGKTDMEDIAAAVRKVERWYATSAPAGQRRSGS